MPDILYDLPTQIRAIEQMDPVHTFLYDTFVTNEGASLAEDVVFDFRKGEEIVAPFVVPHAGGKVIERGKFETKGLTFPSIAPELVLDYLDYGTRSFGENIMGSMSPQERMRKRLAEDFATLHRRIQLRREWMAAQVLFTGKLDLIEYVDGGETTVATKYADFRFTNRFTPATKWNQAGANILDDFMHMFDIAADGQSTPQIGVMGPEVRSAMMNDEKLLKQLDVRNAYFGNMQPGLQRDDALQYIGTVMKNGVELYAYFGAYREKVNTPRIRYVPQGKILIGSSKMLRCIHGPVVQVERENEEPKIYAKEEVPFRYSKTGTSIIKQRMTSRPMMLPENVNAWVVGDVM